MLSLGQTLADLLKSIQKSLGTSAQEEPTTPATEPPARRPADDAVPLEPGDGDPPTLPVPPVVEADVVVVVAPAPEVESAPCQATVRAELSVVNVRSGPGLSFERVVRATGGDTFGVGGVSGPDADGFPWYWIDWAGGSGWVRSDLVTLSGNCATVERVDNLEPEPDGDAAPLPSGERFPLPTPHRITQSYHNNHQAYDLGSPVGTELRAFTDGVVIRRVLCTACTPEKPNILPSSLTAEARSAIFANPAWGFGYGNFLILRFDYDRLPDGLRQEMDRQGLTNGFAYVLYAHLSRVDVMLTQRVSAGDVIGATGNTGHSSGPHLHMEVKIGRAQTVDGSWTRQVVVHPNLLFNNVE